MRLESPSTGRVMRRMLARSAVVVLGCLACGCTSEATDERSEPSGGAPDAYAPTPVFESQTPSGATPMEGGAGIEHTDAARDTRSGDAGPSCQRDDDADGLSNCVEARRCTEPNDADTDGDGLSDAEELRRVDSNPCDADTDGDGLDDGREAAFGLDPRGASSYGDGTRDGNRWFVDACERIGPEPAFYHESHRGNWTVALPPSFKNYTEVSFSNALAARTAAVYDDPTMEVAAFLLARPHRKSALDPRGGLEHAVDPGLKSAAGSVDYRLAGPPFETHDGKRAASAQYEVSTGDRVSTRALRDALLREIAGVFPGGISGLPAAEGPEHSEFRVEVSVISRHFSGGETSNLVSAAVAPLERFETTDRVKFHLDDLVNTTHVADVVDTEEVRCERRPPNGDVPKTEFYWVLDESGSMREENAIVRKYADEFVGRVQNMRLDYRLGVTNMNIGNRGRLGVPPGWHRTPTAFRREIRRRVEKVATDAPAGWAYGSPEEGLEVARRGLQYMLGESGATPRPAERIRSGANVVAIWMSDEAAQGDRLDRTLEFFEGRPNVVGYAMTARSTGENCEPGSPAPVGDYETVAVRSGGRFADLCGGEIRKTLRAATRTAAAIGSEFVLEQTPISRTLRVYVDGEWVPRSREDGFDYSARQNALTFHGDYRPRSNDDRPNDGPEWVAVTYEAFQSRCKTPGSADTCRAPSP